VAVDVQIHSEAYSCGYSLGLTPKFPINSLDHQEMKWKPNSAAKVEVDFYKKRRILEIVNAQESRPPRF
jgi:hypothetical protein